MRIASTVRRANPEVQSKPKGLLLSIEPSKSARKAACKKERQKLNAVRSGNAYVKKSHAQSKTKGTKDINTKDKKSAGTKPAAIGSTRPFKSKRETWIADARQDTTEPRNGINHANDKREGEDIFPRVHIGPYEELMASSGSFAQLEKLHQIQTDVMNSTLQNDSCNSMNCLVEIGFSGERSAQSLIDQAALETKTVAAEEQSIVSKVENLQDIPLKNLILGEKNMFTEYAELAAKGFNDMMVGRESCNAKEMLERLADWDGGSYDSLTSGSLETGYETRETCESQDASYDSFVHVSVESDLSTSQCSSDEELETTSENDKSDVNTGEDNSTLDSKCSSSIVTEMASSTVKSDGGVLSTANARSQESSKSSVTSEDSFGHNNNVKSNDIVRTNDSVESSISVKSKVSVRSNDANSTAKSKDGVRSKNSTVEKVARDLDVYNLQRIEIKLSTKSLDRFGEDANVETENSKLELDIPDQDTPKKCLKFKLKAILGMSKDKKARLNVGTSTEAEKIKSATDEMPSDQASDTEEETAPDLVASTDPNFKKLEGSSLESVKSQAMKGDTNICNKNIDEIPREQGTIDSVPRCTGAARVDVSAEELKTAERKAFDISLKPLHGLGASNSYLNTSDICGDGSNPNDVCAAQMNGQSGSPELFTNLLLNSLSATTSETEDTEKRQAAVEWAQNLDWNAFLEFLTSQPNAALITPPTATCSAREESKMPTKKSLVKSFFGKAKLKHSKQVSLA